MVRRIQLIYNVVTGMSIDKIMAFPASIIIDKAPLSTLSNFEYFHDVITSLYLQGSLLPRVYVFSRI